MMLNVLRRNLHRIAVLEILIIAGFVAGAGGGPLGLIAITMAHLVTFGLTFLVDAVLIHKMLDDDERWTKSIVDSLVANEQSTILATMGVPCFVSVAGILLGAVPRFGGILAALCTWVDQRSTMVEGKIAVVMIFLLVVLSACIRPVVFQQALVERWQINHASGSLVRTRARNVALLSTTIELPLVVGAVTWMWWYEINWAWHL